MFRRGPGVGAIPLGRADKKETGRRAGKAGQPVGSRCYWHFGDGDGANSILITPVVA
jgi:hypothetical protein